ncbi:MAG: proteasome accessory factor PafA2 [Acidimicrobiales bacterium]|nr:proteasome accessory factor PafA2 [Acidimicrobiales bacterium]
MAVPKTIGVETEYGIVLRGTDDPNPISASSLLINAYLSDKASSYRPRVSWDFEDESPARDARGETSLSALAPAIETHLVNAVLTNGARYYVDHAHPEYSTPECADARSLVVHDTAGERILEQSMAAVRDMLPDGQEIIVYKNNSDGKGNSYGCHENYLMDRRTPFGEIVVHGTAHLVSRQVFTGAGKVGTEFPGLNRDEVTYQLTQRADFFEEEVGLETTLKRPIINTRDEPHADLRKYRRLHVIAGDANMSEVSTYLKTGTTAIVLDLVERGAISTEWRFADPVRAMQEVSLDLSLARPIAMADGSQVLALDIQEALIIDARAAVERFGTETIGGDVALDVLDRWQTIIDTLRRDPMELADQLDWVAKYRLLEAYRERHELDWSDARLAAMDIQYHDVRSDRSLARRLGLQRISTDEEVTHATANPPTDTRAYFRGECLRRWGDQIVAANWDSIVFDVGVDPLRRVPMLEPLRGTREHVGTVLEECSTPRELLDRLDS